MLSRIAFSLKLPPAFLQMPNKLSYSRVNWVQVILKVVAKRQRVEVVAMATIMVVVVVFFFIQNNSP